MIVLIFRTRKFTLDIRDGRIDCRDYVLRRVGTTANTLVRAASGVEIGVVGCVVAGETTTLQTVCKFPVHSCG